MITKIFTVVASLSLMFTGALAQDHIAKELRLVQPTVPQAPLVLRSSASATVPQNITFPALLPSVGQVLQATAVSGSNVTTTWVTPAGGGGGGVLTPLISRLLTTQGPGAGPYTAVTVSLDANKSYAFVGGWTVKTANAANSPQVRFRVSAGTVTSIESVLSATDNGEDPVPVLLTNTWYDVPTTSTNQNPFQIQGVITTGGTAPTIVIEFQRTPNSDITVYAGTHIIIF